MALKYQRILLKISGEALGGEKGMGFDEPTMDAICGGVKKAHELGVQIGIVVGGGNFWRGRSSGKMERTLADKIGMLATVMNALAVSDKLEQLGVPTEVFTSITMPQVAQPFTRKDALRAMDEGKIAVFGGGTGNPFFSTDTATALRAVEVSADVMFKATMVDGVYDKDPHKYADAKKYDTPHLYQGAGRPAGCYGWHCCHSVPRQQAAHPRVRSGRPGQHCPCRAGRECGHTGLRGLKRLQPTYIIE